MTVLVTGGSGLVGSHLLDALRARGTPARALVRDASRPIVEAFGAEAVVGDVTDAAAWERAAAGVDAIVHAAALVASADSYEDYLRVNVGGTRLALDAARRARARLVHISSVAVYGRALTDLGVDEDYPFQPLPDRDYYARTKRVADDLVRQEAERGALDVVAIRPNVIYGERDQLFTARLAVTLKRGWVPQIGTGKNHLSCVYAGNVASAILAALDAPPQPGFRAYNVTRDAPPALTQREFFATFARALGVRPRFIRVLRSVVRFGIAIWTRLQQLIRPTRYAALGNSAMAFIVGDNPFLTNRIERELGWRPPFSTGTALERAARSFASPPSPPAREIKSPGRARA